MKRFLRWAGLSDPNLPIFSGLMVLVLQLGWGLVVASNQKISDRHMPSDETQGAGEENVLGWYEEEPRITISDRSWGSNGGVIALTAEDEPTVSLGSSGISGEATVKLYKASEEALFSYLVHDKDGNQVSATFNPDGLPLLLETTVQLEKGYEQYASLALPLEDSGIWLLKIAMNEVGADAFIIRSKTGVLAKEGNDQLVFWGQDFANKRSIGEGVVKLMDLNDQVTTLATAVFGGDGIATMPIMAEADVAFVERNDDVALVPINLHYLNSSYDYASFVPKYRQVRYFTFTDRPLYRPGDTVNFKGFIRDDDDAVYTIPSQSVTVRVTSGWGDNAVEVYKREHSLNSFGGFDGSFELPEDTKTGFYSMAIDANEDQPPANFSDWNSYGGGRANFQVQYFRKPDYFLEVDTNQDELIVGDEVVFSIRGAFFSGQPVTNQEVNYTVYATDFYEYAYRMDRSYLFLDNYRYGWYDGGDVVDSGSVTLDESGVAQIRLTTKAIGDESKVYRIVTSFADESGIADAAAKNVLVYSGEYGIFRIDYQYGYEAGKEALIPMKLVSRKEASVSNIAITSSVKRTWYEELPLEEGQKYHRYQRQEEELPSIQATSDGDGWLQLRFTPKQSGNYYLRAEGTDARRNTVFRDLYVWVSEAGKVSYWSEQNQGLQLQIDREVAEPDGEVRATLSSDMPNRDVMVSFERGRMRRYQIVHMSGNVSTLTLPMEMTDMPNVYLNAASFSDDWLDSVSVNVPIATERKHLAVSIKPDRATYGPGDTAEVEVTTTDGLGRPVAAEVALWAVDKAIFELVDQSNLDIFKAFWRERGDSTSEAHSLEGITVLTAEAGGCFLPDTPVLMADGTTKAISEVRAGEMVLTRTSEAEATMVPARVVSTHETEADGYLTINGTLQVTPNHLLWVNESFREAGSVQIGDVLVDQVNQPVVVETVTYTRQHVSVYNLEVETQHTYMAGGVWVHNQKGEARSVFKDTAYWNPRVVTDGSGKAVVRFVLPDNLTTWAFAAVGATPDTIVGDAKEDIVVTKEVILRTGLPNLLRVGDTAILRALVHNFTNEERTFTVDLEFDSGEVKEATRSGVTIASNELAQVDFEAKPTVRNEKARLTFAAIDEEDPSVGDVVVQTLPVRPFGFYDEVGGAVGHGGTTFDLSITEEIDPELSKVTLSLATTLVGSLPTAMEYLIGYPYGCVEQTTSRFVPAVIAAENQGLFATALLDKDLEEILATGVVRLVELQQNDGGFGWWSEGGSSPFITAYVSEYLVRAKRAGYEVPEDMLARITAYFGEKTLSGNDAVAKQYALTYLNNEVEAVPLAAYEEYALDVVPWAILSNQANGYEELVDRGVEYLVAKKDPQGEGWNWAAGDRSHLGSSDATTGMAVRALVEVGRRDEAYKGVLALMRARQRVYWSNTFATAQVVDGLVAYGQAGDELSPNYSYQVMLDGETLASGRVTSSTQRLAAIELPVTEIVEAGSKLVVIQEGVGQLYSTLNQKLFVVDEAVPAVSEGLVVERRYINDKGLEYTLGMGDTVTVEIKLQNTSGVGGGYAVIEDELPAGMVPINPGFKNEEVSGRYFWRSGVWGHEVTENGMVISIGELPAGLAVYRYKARVVNAGSFQTPPVRASLMYAPEVYGRSAAEWVRIDEKAKVDPTKLIQHKMEETGIPLWQWVVLGGVILGGLSLLSFALYKWRKAKKTGNDIPGDTTPAQVETDDEPLPASEVPMDQPTSSRGS